MDINRHKFQGKYRLSGYEPGIITVNDTQYTHSIVLTPNELMTAWPPQTTPDITADHLAELIALKPDIILIGTGTKHAFLTEKILAPCFEADIPVEMMSTEKACWLFHILVEEHKQVVAGLLP